MEEVIVFDANCSVCNRAAKTIENFNTKSTFTLMSIDQYLKFINLPEEEHTLPEDLFIVKNDATIVSGADAINHILQNLPATRPFRWLFERAIIKKSVVPVYYMMKSLRRPCSTCP